MDTPFEQIYLFRHVMVQEAAYSLYPPTERADLHLHALRSTEALLPEHALPAHAVALADHARAAREGTENRQLHNDELKYVAMAVDYAVSRDLLSEALDHLNRQCELTSDAQRTGVLMRMGSYALALGRFGDAVMYAERVGRDAVKRGDIVGQGKSKRALAVIAASQGNREEGFELLEDSIELFRRAGDSSELIRAVNGKARLLVDSGRYDEAKDLLAELVELCETDNKPFELALSLESLAELQQRTGEPAAALDSYKRADTLMQGHGSPRSRIYAKAGLGHVLVQLGRLDEAEPLVRELIRDHRQSGRHLELANNLETLAELESRRGNVDIAEEHRREGLEVARKYGAVRVVAMVTANLGLYLIDRGKLDEAGSLLLDSLRTREEIGDQPGLGASHLGLGRLRALQGRKEEALGHYRQSLAIHEAIGAGERADECRRGIEQLLDS
ncbi:MAG: tetratricopeptide repeat protein [Planctomycetota bacterium]